jgi:hypothetical protein
MSKKFEDDLGGEGFLSVPYDEFIAWCKAHPEGPAKARAQVQLVPEPTALDVKPALKRRKKWSRR